MKEKAIIYCRVSSKRQKIEGHGLESQEHRARQLADSNNWEVENVFYDDQTGGIDYKERSKVMDLLGYLDTHCENSYHVIFDDLKRLARDTMSYLALRGELAVRKVTPHCLNFRLEDTPESRFVETVIASAGELERRQNKRQVVQKMKARLEAGYWVFQAPLGLAFEKSKEHGKILVPQQPEIGHIKHALELFSKRVLRTKLDFEQYLESRLGDKVLRGNGWAVRILSNCLYAGLIQYEPWGIGLKKGKHPATISPSTFEKNQEILNGCEIKFDRKDKREEFPLRGLVKCSVCGGNLTAAWSTGRKGKKFPYYRCKTPKCLGSIRKQDMEEQFCELLKNIRPTDKLLKLFQAVIEDEYQMQQSLRHIFEGQMEEKVKNLQKQQENAIQCAMGTQNPTLRQAYEREAEKIISQITKLQMSKQSEIEQIDVGTAFLIGKEYLKNPLVMWKAGRLHDKLKVQNMVFQEPLEYDKKQGFGTACFSLTYKVLSSPNISKNQLVDTVRKSWNQICDELVGFQDEPLGEASG